MGAGKTKAPAENGTRSTHPINSRGITRSGLVCPPSTLLGQTSRTDRQPTGTHKHEGTRKGGMGRKRDKGKESKHIFVAVTSLGICVVLILADASERGEAQNMIPYLIPFRDTSQSKIIYSISRRHIKSRKHTSVPTAYYSPPEEVPVKKDPSSVNLTGPSFTQIQVAQYHHHLANWLNAT